MEYMEVDSSDPSMSTSDNDAIELGSTSANDIEELYPSERENHCRLNLGHDFAHKEIFYLRLFSNVSI
jgi:hypothetical protein